MAGPESNHSSENLSQALPKLDRQKNKPEASDMLDSTEQQLASMKEKLEEVQRADENREKEANKPSKANSVISRSPEAKRMEEKWSQMVKDRPDTPVKMSEVFGYLLAVLSDELPAGAQDLASRVLSIMNSNDPKDRDLDPEAARTAAVIESAQARLNDPQNLASLFIKEVMRAA